MARLPLLFAFSASLLLADHAVAGGPLKAKGMLVRPADAVDADAKGGIRIRTDTKKDEHEFEVKIEHVDPLVEHALYVEDALGSGIFVMVDSLDGSGDDADDDGELKLKLRTKHGDMLPLDAADNLSLKGFAVQLRAGEDVVVHGVVPDFDADKHPQLAKQTYGPAEAGDDALKAKLKLRSKADKGDERIKLQVLHLGFPEGRSYSLFLEDGPDSGVLADVGEVEQLGSSANGRFRRRSKKGDALPHDVLSVLALAGRMFELRDDEGGVHVEGEFPGFDD